MKKKDIQIIKTAFLLAIASFLGWLIFDGMRRTFTFLNDLHPLFLISIGLGGIWLITKLGLKK